MKVTYLDFLAKLGIGGAHPGGLSLTKRILSREKINHEMTVLDAGCGTGQTSAFLAKEYKCHVTAIDQSSLMLQKAKSRFMFEGLRINVFQGNIESLPFRDNSFDYVFSESVLAFTNHSKAIFECKRVLKPKGVLLAIEMVLEKPLLTIELNEITQFYGMNRILTVHEWHALYKKANFDDIKGMKVAFFNEENLSDIMPSGMDEHLLKVLEKHEQYTKKYKDTIGFRVFRCSVK